MFPGEYLTRYEKGIRFHNESLKTDPCPNLVRYSPDFLKKKTKVLDIFHTEKKYFIRINLESSSQEIWIRIGFLEEKKPDPHHCLQPTITFIAKASL